MLLSSLEILRLSSILFLVIIGTIFDLFNKRRIPTMLFFIPGLFGLYLLISEFNYAYLTIVIFSLVLISLFQTFKLWNWADSITFVIITLHYQLLIFPILFIGSVFMCGFWITYLKTNKKMSIKNILKSKTPFLPSFLVGFLVIILMGF